MSDHSPTDPALADSSAGRAGLAGAFAFASPDARRAFWWFLAIQSFHWTMVLFSSPRLSPAYDEPIHVRAGLAILSRGEFVDPERAWWTRPDPLTPPSDILAGIAARAAGTSPDFRGDPFPSFDQVLGARWSAHPTGALLLAVVFLWGLRLHGPEGAALSAAMLGLHPTFLGHSTIVGSDLPGALGAVVFVGAIWWHLVERPPREDFGTVLPPRSVRLACRNLAVAGALAIACKLSTIPLLALVPVAVFAAIRSMPGPVLRRIAGASCFSLAAVGGALLFAAIAYESTPSDLPADAPPIPGSHLMRALEAASTLPDIHSTVSVGGGVWPVRARHFAGAFLRQTPLPLLLLFGLLPVAAWMTARESRSDLARESAFDSGAEPDSERAAPPGPRDRDRSADPLAILCVAGALAALYATRGIYIGLRHMLPCIALAAVAGGCLLRLPALIARLAVPEGELPPAANRRVAALLAACAGWAAVEAAHVAPWHVSYRGPLGRAERPGDLGLVDAGADWGTGLVDLARWQRAKPDDAPLWLSYFGNARPEDFGVEYRGLVSPFSYVMPDERMAFQSDPRVFDGWVAISLTHLAGNYMPTMGISPDHFLVWREREPALVLGGGTIRVFDCRKDRTAGPGGESRRGSR